MEPIILKRNSWHGWLIDQLDIGQFTSETDICTYTGWVLGALLKGFVLILLGTIFLASLLFGIVVSGETLGYLLALAVYGWIEPEQTSLIGIVLLSIATGILSVFGVFNFLHRLPQDNFVPQAWRALKEKTCRKVRIE